MEVRKVLFVVDLAGSSYRIVSEVRAVVEQYKAELHLVHVDNTLEGYNTFFIPHPSLDLIEAEDMVLSEKHLIEFAEKYFEECPKIVVSALRGNPAEELKSYIESQKIDLVIVSHQKKSLLERAIFGDNIEPIARMSPVPVMAVNPFLQIPA